MSRNKDFKRVKKIKLPIYPFDIVFTILSKEGEKSFTDFTEAKVIKDDLTIFFYFRDEKVNIPTIAHEVFHATEFIMLTVGQQAGQMPNEAWAYLLEYLMRETLDFLKLK